MLLGSIPMFFVVRYDNKGRGSMILTYIKGCKPFSSSKCFLFLKNIRPLQQWTLHLILDTSRLDWGHNA